MSAVFVLHRSKNKKTYIFLRKRKDNRKKITKFYDNYIREPIANYIDTTNDYDSVK